MTHFGGKTVRLEHSPGHSPDLINAWVVTDRVLFASDTVMPVPTIFDGSHRDLVASLNELLNRNLDCVVRGHGEVILRGEIDSLINSDLSYLSKIKEVVQGLGSRILKCREIGRQLDRQRVFVFKPLGAGDIQNKSPFLGAVIVVEKVKINACAVIKIGLRSFSVKNAGPARESREVLGYIILFKGDIGVVLFVILIIAVEGNPVPGVVQHAVDRETLIKVISSIEAGPGI